MMPPIRRLKSHAGGYNNIVTQRLPDELDAHRHTLIVVPGR